MDYTWDFSAVTSNLPLLLEGLMGTFRVFLASLAIGLPSGVLLALMRLSRHPAIAVPTGGLIEVLRATPNLVLLFWVFFALPILVNIVIDPYEAAVITLSLSAAAFSAEAVRGGIASIERGQWDAARALAMSPGQVMRRVVLPQAIKRMLPALFERGVELLKATTLVSTVSYADLLFKANDLVSQSYRPMEIYSFVAIVYFVLILAASQAARLLEVRLARSGESGGH
jgi:polar amino acid transport system permease protein